MTSWDLIQRRDYAQALELALEEARSKGTDLPLRNAVFVLFKLNRLNDAYELAIRIRREEDHSTSAAGCAVALALWFLGDTSGATAALIEARSAMYQDQSGGIDVLLLLRFFAVSQARVDAIIEVDRCLKERIRKVPKIWPAPLASRILGEKQGPPLESIMSSVRQVRERQECQTRFHLTLGCLGGASTAAELRTCLEPEANLILVPEHHLACRAIGRT